MKATSRRRMPPAAPGAKGRVEQPQGVELEPGNVRDPGNTGETLGKLLLAIGFDHGEHLATQVTLSNGF